MEVRTVWKSGGWKLTRLRESKLALDMVARLGCRVDAKRESAIQVLRGLRATFIEKRFVDIALWLHRPSFVIAMSSMEGRGPASCANRAGTEPPLLDASLTSASLTPFGRGNSRDRQARTAAILGTAGLNYSIKTSRARIWRVENASPSCHRAGGVCSL